MITKKKREMKITISTISIYLCFLFTCSYISAHDHHQADEYWYKAQDLEKQGRYLEAAKLYERAVQAERKSPDSRKSKLITEISQTGYCFFLAGQNGKAVTFFEEAMAKAKKLKEEEKVANCLNYFGLVYTSVGQYDKAIKFYEQAIAIERKLGMEEKVAMRFNNMSETCRSWEKYDRAIGYLEDAIEIERKLGMKAKVALRLSCIGEIYHLRGQYEKASEFYKKALTIQRELPHEEKVTASLNNLGRVYEEQGQYERANKYYEEALTLCRELGQEGQAATCLNNLGRICENQGQYEKASGYYDEALMINSDLRQADQIVTSLNHLGRISEIRGQYENAIIYYNGSLAINRALKREDKVAVNLNSLGSVYKTQKQYAKAVKCYEEALEIDKKLGKEANDARISKELDMVYTFYWSKHDKVIIPNEEVLAINKKLACDTNVFNDLNNLGKVYLLQKEYKRSIKYFLDSLSIIKKSGKSIKEKVRRDYFTNQLDTYQWLAKAYVGDNDIFSALQTVELRRTKILADRFSIQERLMKLPEVKQIHDTVESDTAILVYACVGSNDFLLFAITDKDILCKEVSCTTFIQSSLDKYDTQIGNFAMNQRSLRGDRSDLDTVVNYYGSLLRGASSQNETRLSASNHKLEKNDNAEAGEIGRALYELLMRPMEAQISDKRNLIIIPDGILSLIPFETLIDDNGHYLVEEYNIRHIQSLYLRKLIEEREYREKRKPLLAFGGAMYHDSPDKIEVIENGIQLSILKKGIYSDLANQLSVRNSYGALGIGAWPALPNTLNEVNNMKSVFNKSNVFTGRNVAERHIKELSRNGTLDNYKVLHFATHALVVAEVPELSALVLSQLENEGEKEDGYLRMGEIAKLELHADLVNLSACETSLNNIFGSEGFMGLTQSFLLAGARAVSISLWQVSDESTSRFMETLYGVAQNGDISYPNAITAVKRQFIGGEFGERYKSPYYWAPFVYYGN